MIKAVTVHCFFYGLNEKQVFVKQARMLENLLKPYSRGEADFVRKKKEPHGSVGIKNSWKYEKDLILILNQDNLKKTISRVGSI